MRQVGSIWVVLGLCGAALAQAPVGSSTTVLNGSRLGISAEGGWADVDVHFAGGAKENYDFSTSYASLSAALTSRWDFFVRLGGSRAEGSSFDGDWNISWGLGTRATVFQWHDFSWGVMGQLTNLISRADVVEVVDVNGVPTPFAGREELNLMEYVFATGPTWQHGPVSLYGGLLVRLVDGEREAVGGDLVGQVDVDGQWEAGGYVGGRVSFFRVDPSRTYGFNRCDLVLEGRFTGDSTGFSVGVLLPFGGES